MAAFTASSRTTADGLDAADILGGQYALAKQYCEDPNAPDDLIKAIMCSYAQNAPEVPWAPFQLETIVCTCAVQPSVGGPPCDYADPSHCDSSTGSMTSGPVTANHYEWGPVVVCLNVASLHIVRFSPTEEFDYAYCPPA